MASARTLKMVQCDLWTAIEAYRHNRCASANRGVAGHVVVAPWSRSQTARQHRVERDRNSTGKANLAAMGVTAEHEVKAGM